MAPTIAIPLLLKVYPAAIAAAIHIVMIAVAWIFRHYGMFNSVSEDLMQAHTRHSEP